MDWFEKRKFDNFVKDVEAGKLPEVSLEKPENGRITIIEDGFSVELPHQKGISDKSVCWDAIEEIRGYKRDLFAVDLICWGFCLQDEEYVLEVNEEMLGFAELVKSVEAHFDIKSEDWWSKVAIPAFDTNMTVIWRRGDQSKKALQQTSD